MKNTSLLLRTAFLGALAITLASAAGAQAAAPPGNSGAAPASGGATVALVWNTFLPVAAFPYVASTFTPDAAVTVTRIQAQVAVVPVECRTNAVLQISNTPPSGTPATIVTLELKSAANDSGSIAVSYPAGSPIALTVSAPAECWFGQGPALVNVVVQYSSQSNSGAAAAPAPAAPAAGSAQR